MKVVLLIITFNLISANMLGQEICDNGVDDDFDGLIDLNDEDCNCGSYSDIIGSLLPNPSFEDTLCCPDSESDIPCTEAWQIASDASPDLHHICGFYDAFAYVGWEPGNLPLPTGGEAFVGLGLLDGVYTECVGVLPLTELTAGTTYKLHFYTAWATGSTELGLAIFGTSLEEDLPWDGIDCPVGHGGWQELSSVDVEYIPDGSWSEVEMTFTPDTDISAVAFGAKCGFDLTEQYFYIDDLTLVEAEIMNTLPKIFENGELCFGDYTLLTATGIADGTWQWYLDGIALVGETGEVINVESYGDGTYCVVLTVDGNCVSDCYVIEPWEEIEPNFTFEDACFGTEIEFINTSVWTDGADPEWLWLIGEDFTSTEENITYLPPSPGTYTVKLLVEIENGCRDSVETELTIFELPEVEIMAIEDSVLCPESPPIELNASPLGGLFSGAGVAGSYFIPNDLEVGSYLSYYHYEDLNGCIGVDSVQIEVVSCLSTTEENDLIIISPNPFHDAINIQFSSNWECVNIMIYNTLSELIYSELDFCGAQLSIPQSEIGNGTFFLMAFDEFGNNLGKTKIVSLSEK